MEYPLEGFDVIHASPPCQAYSMTNRLDGSRERPTLITDVRERLRWASVPYVIENVRGAPLFNPLLLTGAMFGLLIKRDRLFESNYDIGFKMSPAAPPAVKMGRPVKDGDIIQPVGHFSNVAYARRAMDISWMTSKELSQAIPPAYTEYIGRELLRQLAVTEAVKA